MSDRPSTTTGPPKRRPFSPVHAGRKAGGPSSSSSRPPQQADRPSHGPALAGVAPAAATPIARSKSVLGGAGRSVSGSGTPLLTATGVHSARRVFYGNNQQFDGSGSPGLGGGSGEPVTYWCVSSWPSCAPEADVPAAMASDRACAGRSSGGSRSSRRQASRHSDQPCAATLD